MSLTPGTRIGPYEVVALLGAGGMGEVYRARDPRLGRDVAIKALPASLAHDVERLARFEREARLLASLNHPNIAGLYGLEEAGGQRYLVLEFVDGLSLAQRLAPGALALDEALQVCRDVAAGVEAAHEGGIVHRDLKPGNVMLTPAGAVKVLDFGLAKGGGAARDIGSDPTLSASPTMTYAATQAGMVLGTAAYMSPEQARGKNVDRRTDIWSFGCVLFECLTGKPVFEGETISDLLARILEREPDWSTLPARVPPRVRELLRRCLVKDPKQRLRDIGDARLELDQALAQLSSGSVPAYAGEPMPAARRGPSWFATVAIVFATAAATLAVVRATRPHAAPIAHHFEISAPTPFDLVADPVECALSPDGRSLAMVLADSSGTSHLWVRPIDSFKARPLAGTDNVTQPFWSPDGRSLAFFAGTKLKKIAVAGGDPEIVCDVRSARGGAWSPDGVILFAPTSNGALFSVPAAGGDPKAVTQLDPARKETAHRFPRFLPDGKHFLFSVLTGNTDRFSIQVGALGETKRTEIFTATSGAEYSAPGYLLFARNGALTAQKFDAGSLRLSGEPVSLGDSPRVPATSGARIVSAAADGTLAYMFEPLPAGRLAWFDPDGRESGQVPLTPGVYGGISISPDGRSACLHHQLSMTQNELLVVDLERGTSTRLTDGTLSVENVAWSPDGKRIAYAAGNNSSQVVILVPADGSGPGETVLPPGNDFRRLDSWTPDGKALVIGRLDPQTQWDLWVLPLEGDRKLRPYLRTPANETGGNVSPDGHWLSYNSDESGRVEGYVQSFPEPGSRHQITTDGSSVLGWNRDGKRLAVSPLRDRMVREVDVLPGAEFRVGPLRGFARIPENNFSADATKDWTRLLVVMPAGKPAEASIRLLLDWTAMLAKP